MSSQNAAMGLRVLGLSVTNCGSEELELNGYPSVRLMDADEVLLPVEVGHGSFGISTGAPHFDAPPAPVVVPPGESASTALLWRNTYTDMRSPPVVGEALEVAVADGMPAQTFFPLDDSGNPVTIDLGSTGRVGVAPWRLP